MVVFVNHSIARSRSVLLGKMESFRQHQMLKEQMIIRELKT
jgi:hypothetical protein